MNGGLAARPVPRMAGAAIAIALFSLIILSSRAQALPDGSFWGKVAGPGGAADRADRNDIAALLERVEAAETSGRFDAACALLERALPRYAGAERAAAWFRLGVVRSKLGRYREAAVAYAAVVADGAADSAVYSNYAEVLMAAGRLPEAEARYRDAISAASDLGVGDRRERTHELAMAYYGLAVALDRDEQPVAAREAMQRALAHDPTAAVLRLASTSGGDLFFIPDGDVFYYVGLAAEAEGRDGDAEAAFREFIAHAPRSRWARAAEAHLGKKGASAGAAAGKRRALAAVEAIPRVVAHGTVLATGGIAAPLIDAAWRDQLPILDDCLDGVRLTTHATSRIAIEMEVDARGRLTRVIVKAPAPFDERFAHCVESATKRRLRLSVPAAGRPTTARTEMVVRVP
jgi:tetratricopeptide (TPR) repeat protein